jgi:predicted anti-sigma-YlaC factor YlaD
MHHIWRPWISLGIVGVCVVVVVIAAGFFAVATMKITTPAMVMTARIPHATYHFQVLNNPATNRKGKLTTVNKQPMVSS